MNEEQKDALRELDVMLSSLKAEMKYPLLISEGNISLMESLVSANQKVKDSGLEGVDIIPSSWDDWDIDCLESLTSLLRGGYLDGLDPNMSDDEYSSQVDTWRDEILGQWEEVVDAISSYLSNFDLY